MYIRRLEIILTVACARMLFLVGSMRIFNHFNLNSDRIIITVH